MSEPSGSEIYRSRSFEFYSLQLQEPLLLVASATALFLLSRSLRLRSNILHTLALFTLSFFFGFVCNLVIGGGGLAKTNERGLKARENGIQYAIEFQFVFRLLGLVGTQLVACQLVYPDSKTSEKWIYRIVTGLQALLAIVIFGIRTEYTRFSIKVLKLRASSSSYNFSTEKLYLGQYSRYIIIAFYGIGLLSTTLIMWGSLRFRRQKATFPQTTQKRLVGYSITFPMFIVYIFSLAKAAFEEVWWRLDVTNTERFVYITVPNTVAALSWFIFGGLLAYFIGWIFLVEEWKKGNRASKGNVSMADYDMKPNFLVDDGHNGGKDAHSSVSV